MQEKDGDQTLLLMIFKVLIIDKNLILKIAFVSRQGYVVAAHEACCHDRGIKYIIENILALLRLVWSVGYGYCSFMVERHKIIEENHSMS